MERRVFVTGAGSGVGLATIVRAAAAGFVPIAAVHTDAEATRVRAAVEAAGTAVETRVFDLADEGARAAAVEGLELYALVNSAGYLNPGELADVSLAAGRRQLEVLAVAPVHLARLCAPAMAARGEGRIVNVVSAALETAVPLMGWYRAAKAALAALGDTLRIELAPEGIEVVAIWPGGLRTPLWDAAADDLRRRSGAGTHPLLYARALRILEAARPHMAGPERVAARICDVLVSGCPKPRYRVGPDAGLLAAARAVFPERARDALAGTIGGIGGR